MVKNPRRDIAPVESPMLAVGQIWGLADAGEGFIQGRQVLERGSAGSAGKNLWEDNPELLQAFLHLAFGSNQLECLRKPFTWVSEDIFEGVEGIEGSMGLVQWDNSDDE